MKVIKIKMKPYRGLPNGLEEVDGIYLTCSGSEPEQMNGFHPVEEIHDYLRVHPHAIQVNLPPYPSLIPVLGPAPRHKKAVRSAPDRSSRDNLLSLPRA